VSRIFVAGAFGGIGRRLTAELGPETVTIDQNGADLDLELLRPLEFAYGEFAPGDVVIHLAAISSPDTCERESALAWNINVRNTSVFIERALARGVKVIFFSSDVVYWQRDDPADENSICTPISNYAAMKRRVEETFAADSSFKAFRLSYVLSSKDRFLSYLAGCFEKGIAAEVYDSLWRNVVHIGDVMAAARAVAEDWEVLQARVLNVIGPKCVSRYDLAEAYREQVAPGLQIIKTEPDPGFFSARPRRIALRSLYLKEVLGREPVTIDEALKREFVSPAAPRAK
jgi:dTDP-4-dehydrorhamnose reductase